MCYNKGMRGRFLRALCWGALIGSLVGALLDIVPKFGRGSFAGLDTWSPGGAIFGAMLGSMLGIMCSSVYYAGAAVGAVVFASLGVAVTNSVYVSGDIVPVFMFFGTIAGASVVAFLLGHRLPLTARRVIQMGHPHHPSANAASDVEFELAQDEPHSRAITSRFEHSFLYPD